MNLRHFFLLVIPSVFALGLSAQIVIERGNANPSSADQYHKQRADLLNKNTSLLAVSVELDRTVYLPGELAYITISVTNGSATALEAFAPFQGFTGLMELSALIVRNGKETWLSFAEDPSCCQPGRKDDQPIYIFAQGEKITKTMRSDEPNFGFAKDQLLRVPRKPGKYRLRYTFNQHKSVEFEVVPALIRKVECAPFAAKKEYVSPSKEHFALSRQVNAAVLESAGGYYVVLSSVRNNNACSLSLPDSGDFSFWVNELLPYLRLASSDKPIVTLRVVTDKQENITVFWTASDGKAGSTKVSVDKLGGLGRERTLTHN